MTTRVDFCLTLKVSRPILSGVLDKYDRFHSVPHFEMRKNVFAGETNPLQVPLQRKVQHWEEKLFVVSATKHGNEV